MEQKLCVYNKVKASNLLKAFMLRRRTEMQIVWEYFLNRMLLASLDICVLTHTYTVWKVGLSSSVTHQYVQQCMRLCWPVGMSVCTLGLWVWVPMCLSVHSVRGRGGRGGVSCSIWSLTCCGALLRPPCLEVSSAGIGRLHASSIRGSILLLPCRLLSWGLLNWA